MKHIIQRIKNLFWHLPKGVYANIRFGHPGKDLVLIGVTGTDGKTTTATAIHRCLVNYGINADLLTTVNSPGLHTTSPDSMTLQKILRQMVSRGTTHCVIETTAHGLDQFRFYGCHFTIGVITNTSHEHLDDFSDMDTYIKAKSRLFSQSSIKIFNADDQSFKFLSQSYPQHLSYSIKAKSDYTAKDISLQHKKLKFCINQLPIVTNSSYRYQVYNILAVYSVCNLLKIPDKIIVSTLRKFPDIAGRRQIIDNQLGLQLIVDFAHTPMALEQTLKSLKETNHGRLICLFGATGGRDSSKRPMMGKVVSEYADVAIITSDDTRNEDIKIINQQIISGINKRKLDNKQFSFYNIPDRQKAFDMAISIATKGDTIIACGKGHETTILHGKTEYPWSDAQAFRTAIKNINVT